MKTTNKKKITSKHMKIGSLCAAIGCFIELIILKDNLFPEIVINTLAPIGYILIFYYFALSYNYFKEKNEKEDKDSI